MMYIYSLQPYRLARQGIVTLDALEILLQQLQLQYFSHLVAPGELVGILAGQSCGASNTQSSLDSFHTANGSAQQTHRLSGIARIEELMSLKESIQTPYMVIIPSHELLGDCVEQESRVNRIAQQLICTYLKDIVSSTEIYYAPWDTDATTPLFDPDHRLMERFRRYSALESIYADNFADTKTGVAPDMCPWVLRLQFDREKMSSKIS
jgi:DNA-directed RNA polymerase II subunit RPB1